MFLEYSWVKQLSRWPVSVSIIWKADSTKLVYNYNENLYIYDIRAKRTFGSKKALIICGPVTVIKILKWWDIKDFKTFLQLNWRSVVSLWREGRTWRVWQINSLSTGPQLLKKNVKRLQLPLNLCATLCSLVNLWLEGITHVWLNSVNASPCLLTKMWNDGSKHKTFVLHN